MNQTRRHLLLATALLWASGVRAQPALRRIAVLSLAPRSEDSRLQEFERALAQLGHVDGQDIDIEWRHTDDRPERLPGLVTDVLQNQATLIVVTSTTALEAVRNGHETWLSGRDTGTVPFRIDSLLSRARAHAPALPPLRGGHTLIKAYLRDRSDLPVVEQALRERLPPGTPFLVLAGDVCRGDLLVELDCLHSTG